MATKTTQENQVFNGRYLKDNSTTNELLRKYNALSVEIKALSDEQKGLRSEIVDLLEANNNKLITKEFSATLSISAESTKLVSMQTAKIVLKNNPTLLKAMSTVKESFSRVLVKPIAKI